MQEGHFSVTNGHQLYYETYGNKEGEPILFLHGGPGAGFSEKDKDFFDSTRHYVILFEQRGTGRSLPLGSLENNTAAHLVADINRLLNFFKIEKVTLFGGSWGSTLALLYAIEYPQRVTKMILRGICLGTSTDVKHLFGGGGAALFMPEAWERFAQTVPPEQDVVAFYYENMQAENISTCYFFAYEWALYGTQVYLPTNTLEEIAIQVKEDPLFYERALLVAHYAAHDFFLKEDYILKNVASIGDIPTIIVQGRYDLICPPKFAYQLSQKLSNATLYMLDAGHGAHEEAIKKQLQRSL